MNASFVNTALPAIPTADTTVRIVSLRTGCSSGLNHLFLFSDRRKTPPRSMLANDTHKAQAKMATIILTCEAFISANRWIPRRDAAIQYDQTEKIFRSNTPVS